MLINFADWTKLWSEIYAYFEFAELRPIACKRNNQFVFDEIEVSDYFKDFSSNNMIHKSLK